MNLILLSGMNASTERWIEEVEDSVEGQFASTAIQRYLHWQRGEEEMDLTEETLLLTETTNNLDEYAIFAKSAGTWVVLKAVNEGLIHPKKCVFAGIAVNFGRANNVPVDDWLEGYSVPTLFVQKSADPAIGFAELEELLEARHVTNQTLVEVPGDDHHYENVFQLGQFITDFAA